MSQNNQPRCVVVVEPMSKAVEESTKESSKKKTVKEVEEKTNGSMKESEVTSNGKESKKESSSSKENGSTPHVNGKGSKKEKKNEKEEQPAPTEKSASVVKNGVSDVVLNTAVVTPTEKEIVPESTPEVANVEEVPSQNAEPDNDDLFPELNYDDTSDNECNFDSSSPEFSPVNAVRSITRRSQAKKIPTPDTPQHVNAPATPDVDEAGLGRSSNTPERTTPSKEKMIKMKEIYSPIGMARAQESARRTRGSESPSIESEDGESRGSTENGKTETNYSKSRVKVSPYRRSTRISEQYSTMANYSGNNTTQQTDIIADISSSSRDMSPAKDDGDSDTTQQDKSFLESYRHITSRRSYKTLRELSLRNLSVQRKKQSNDTKKDDSISSVNATVDPQSTCDSLSSESNASSNKWTPVGHVIGRKRRQDDLQDESPASSQTPSQSSPSLLPPASDDDKMNPPSKRMRLLGYMTTPLGYVASPLKQLRDKVASSTPILRRRSLKAWKTEEPSATATTSSGDVTMGEEATENVPTVETVPPVGGGDISQPGHKWCSIM